MNMVNIDENKIELRNKGIGVFVFEDYIFGAVCSIALIVMMIRVF